MRSTNAHPNWSCRAAAAAVAAAAAECGFPPEGVSGAGFGLFWNNGMSYVAAPRKCHAHGGLAWLAPLMACDAMF